MLSPECISDHNSLYCGEKDQLGCELLNVKFDGKLIKLLYLLSNLFKASFQAVGQWKIFACQRWIEPNESQRWVTKPGGVLPLPQLKSLYLTKINYLFYTILKPIMLWKN